MKMKFLSCIDYNGYGEIVAYKNINNGNIISRNEYIEMLETEIMEFWEALNCCQKKEYGSYKNFREYYINLPDPEYIPLYEI